MSKQKRTDVPETIDDKQMASLSDRARKADKVPWLSKEGTDRRKAGIKQREQRHLS